MPGVDGILQVQSAEEVALWEKSAERYIEDYQLSKTNDLVLLSAILQQQLILFRAQRRINGMKPETDPSGVPTGRYVMEELESDEIAGLTKILNTATGEIRSLEKALGIDKVTREAGGQVSVTNYLRTLKTAAHLRGIHVSKRFVAYEGFANQLRTMLRMNSNLDPEDRAYHDLTPEKILQWCADELGKLEELDKRFAHEKGKLYVGKL